MTRRSIVSLLLALAAPSLAEADAVSVRRGQFTDRIERGAPVGGAAAIAPGGRVVYWLEVSNPGAATQVTVVWSVGGREVARHTLEVGRAPRWRTWASLPRRRAGRVEVRVLDAAGATIHRARLQRP